MSMGVIVCGLNGSGKSTLGKALSEKLSYHFIDSEDLFFEKMDSDYIFTTQRTKWEAVKLLMEKVKVHKDFVFATVKGDYGEDILKLYRYAVLIRVPKDIRLMRVKERSFQKFGNRMLPGGELYEREKEFFDMVNHRADFYVEQWVQSLKCPIIQVDGTNPIEKNIGIIMEQMQSSSYYFE